ncbi:hypothetical protein [Marinirhabdus gelatinilytica]|nr:hypothetical protein [Marinirhabdus gelatinilytica]
MTQFVNAKTLRDDDVKIVLEEMGLEMSLISKTFIIKLQQYEERLFTTHQMLRSVNSVDEKLHWLLQKEDLEKEIDILEARYLSDISKIRYLKGLQIIKILYEKTLSLDHHFSTVSTLNEINKISNPNQYEEFREVKELLQTKKEKKAGFDLSTILGNNIYTSVVHSFVSLFTNENTSKVEKQGQIKDVECILDFTLRMHQDLNTIYFETVFLQKSNETIMEELEKLFNDYTQPIHYKTALKKCRENDDWGAVRNNLNEYLDNLNTTIASGNKASKVRSMQIDLQFPIDRLLQFITQYNAFIDQGEKFYEKFGIMLNSYENEQQCANEIPTEYQTLKNNISLSIEKFNTAYKPIEINGSKLKQLLYGINEYE